MAGNPEGGKLAAKKNKEKHGADFYARIGAMGGRKGRTGGFASKIVDENGLTGQERARKFGAMGGRISRRTKAVKPVVKSDRDDFTLAA
ncbi:MAG TPA: hypothetical protein VIM53_03715 [Candidatus Saccharimonadales bacterium]